MSNGTHPLETLITIIIINDDNDDIDDYISSSRDETLQTPTAHHTESMFLSWIPRHHQQQGQQTWTINFGWM